MRSVLLYLATAIAAVALVFFIAQNATWFSQCINAQAAGFAEIRMFGSPSYQMARSIDRACRVLK